MNKECKDCDFYCDGGCFCPSMDKWYACPIESRKPENQQALKEYAEQVRRVKNKTNGDVIMAMFPNCRPCVGSEIVDTDIAVFESEWWGAPYEREDKKNMTREEIDNVVEEIREHCRNRECRNCEAKTIHGCVFMTSYPNEWYTTKEADEEDYE